MSGYSRSNSTTRPRTQGASLGTGGQGGSPGEGTEAPANCRNINETVPVRNIPSGISFQINEMLTVALNPENNSSLIVRQAGLIAGAILPRAAADIIRCMNSGESFGATVSSIEGPVVRVQIRALL